MKSKIISEIQSKMKPHLSPSQQSELTKILVNLLADVKAIKNKIKIKSNIIDTWH
jgi:hypothetical protein